MATTGLRTTTTLRPLASALRPAPFVSRVARRYKTGPFDYTQSKALVFSKEGDPRRVLNLHTYSITPTLPDWAVILRTLAAPINPADINTIQGTYGSKPRRDRFLGTPEPCVVPGNEGVFEVVAVGSKDLGLCKRDWVIPAKPSFGTWRTHHLVAATDVMKIPKQGLTPTQVATVSVNPCTAYRILRTYGPGTIKAGSNGGMTILEPGSGGWFIQNGANSGVGRAAIQLGKAWGLRSINVVRERESEAETAALKKELIDLGATVVITEKEFFAIEWADQLKEITRDGLEPVGLGLNCVGGKSATAIARSLSESGTMVTYGGMSKKPVMLPTGQLIFKDIRFVGFWLTKWNDRDPTGRRFAIVDLLDMMREGRFKDAPVEEVVWDWETEEEVLKEAVGGALDGFRKGKGVFVFGQT